MLLGDDNEDNPNVNPTDPDALVGTWVSDLSGKTFSIWNYGKSWNVWKFNADGTGVCDVYFLAGDEPVALQHQPFTYTAKDGNITVTPEQRQQMVEAYHKYLKKGKEKQVKKYEC